MGARSFDTTEMEIQQEPCLKWIPGCHEMVWWLSRPFTLVSSRTLCCFKLSCDDESNTLAGPNIDTVLPIQLNAHRMLLFTISQTYTALECLAGCKTVLTASMVPMDPNPSNFIVNQLQQCLMALVF